MKKMNILMVLENDFPPDVRVENEIRILLAQGYRISLLCSSLMIKSRRIENYMGVKVIKEPMSLFVFKSGALALTLPFYHKYWKKNIKKVIKEEEFDVILIHDLPLAMVGARIGHRNNIKVIADFHENRPEIMKMYHYVITFPGNLLISVERWNKYQKTCVKLVDKLILVTKEAKDYYIKSYNVPESKIGVFPNYPDIEALSRVKVDDTIVKKYKDKFMIVYFGDTGLRRGTMTIIETAKKMKNLKKYHFVIIGKSKEQSILEDMIKEYGLTNVELMGYLIFDLIISYIVASQIGLCPFLRNIHHDTTYANKLFQFMFFRKPVIVSDCPAQEKVVLKEHCGLVYTAGNPDELKESILKIDNPTTIDEFGSNGYNAVISKYNNQSSHVELIDIFASVVA